MQWAYWLHVVQMYSKYSVRELNLAMKTQLPILMYLTYLYMYGSMPTKVWKFGRVPCQVEVWLLYFLIVIAMKQRKSPHILHWYVYKTL